METTINDTAGARQKLEELVRVRAYERAAQIVRRLNLPNSVVSAQAIDVNFNLLLHEEFKKLGLA